MINIARNKLDTRAVEDNRVGSDGWRWGRLRFGWSRKAILRGGTFELRPKL